MDGWIFHVYNKRSALLRKKKKKGNHFAELKKGEKKRVTLKSTYQV